MSDALARLKALQAADLPVHGGRTLAYVYDSGLPDVDRIGREAVAAYAGSNGLDPTAFPSLLRMENDLVGFALGLLDGPGHRGRHRHLGRHRVGAARGPGGARRAPGRRPSPAWCCRPPRTRRSTRPRTTSAWSRCWCRSAPTSPPTSRRPRRRSTRRPTGPCWWSPARRRTPTASSTRSPSSRPLAAARGIRCHVDACIGGWVLPYAARLGRAVPPWTFAVEGVTSISVDLHKYGYAPKGTSLLLHRTPELRRPQFFASAAWPGYTMLNSTMQSTKSGGPLAGAWAVVESLGDTGYELLSREVFEAVDAIVAGTADIPGVDVARSSTVDADRARHRRHAATRSRSATRWRARDWYVQPQMSYAGTPPTIHLSVSAATGAHVDEFLDALARLGRGRPGRPARSPSTPTWSPSSRPSTRAALTDADFDGLLAASGLVGAGDDGGLALPDRLAEVNALLDLAAPAMREALLIAFLDRLSRPHR